MTFTRFVGVFFLLLIFLQLLHPIHSEWNPAGHGVIKTNSSMVSQDLKDSPYFRCAMSRQDTSPGHVRWSCCKGLFLGPTGRKYRHRCSIFGGRLLVSFYDFFEVGIRTTRIDWRAVLGEVNDLFQEVWKNRADKMGHHSDLCPRYKPPGSRDAQSKRWKAAQQLRLQNMRTSNQKDDPFLDANNGAELFLC